MNNNCNSNNKNCEQIKNLNMNAHFIAPNPVTSFNKKSIHPTIHSSVYIGPFTAIIGDVTIKENVFIAPNVSIRADEGSPFYIGSDTNIQDGVIMHGLEHGRVTVNEKQYSIYIGKRVTCAHRCILHGPCKIGDDVFIGFNSIAFNCVIGDGCYISANVLITEGITIAPNRFIPSGAIIDTQDKADKLDTVAANKSKFVQGVQQVNHEFPKAYTHLPANSVCSCGYAKSKCK